MLIVDWLCWQSSTPTWKAVVPVWIGMAFGAGVWFAWRAETWWTSAIMTALAIHMVFYSIGRISWVRARGARWSA